MAQIPNLKFDKNKAFLTEQLEVQKSNRNNVSDIIANIKFINTSYNCNQYYLEDLLKTGDELLASFDNNVSIIEELTENLGKITSSLNTILSPKNQKSKTKSYFINSFTELEKDVTEYSKKFNALMKKIENDSTSYNTFIASCNLNSAVDAAISDNPADIMKIMQENLVEKDNVFSSISSNEENQMKDENNDVDTNNGKTENTDMSKDSSSNIEGKNIGDNNDTNTEVSNIDTTALESNLFNNMVTGDAQAPVQTTEQVPVLENSIEKDIELAMEKAVEANGDFGEKANDITENAEEKTQVTDTAAPNDQDQNVNSNNNNNIYNYHDNNYKNNRNIKPNRRKNKKSKNNNSSAVDMPIESSFSEIKNEAKIRVASNTGEKTIVNESLQANGQNNSNKSEHISITEELKDILDNVDDFKSAKKETKVVISKGVQGLINASSNFTVKDLKHNNQNFYSNLNSMISEYDDFSAPISHIDGFAPTPTYNTGSISIPEPEPEPAVEEENHSGLKPIHINNSNFYNYDNSSYTYHDISQVQRTKNQDKQIIQPVNIDIPENITDISAEDVANRTMEIDTDEVNAKLAESKIAGEIQTDNVSLEDTNEPTIVEISPPNAEGSYITPASDNNNTDIVDMVGNEDTTLDNALEDEIDNAEIASAIDDAIADATFDEGDSTATNEEVLIEEVSLLDDTDANVVQDSQIQEDVTEDSTNDTINTGGSNDDDIVAPSSEQNTADANVDIVDDDETIFDDYFDDESITSLDEVEDLADALNNSDNVTITMEDKKTNVETIVKGKAGGYNPSLSLSKDKIERIIRADADNETLIISEKNNKIYLPYKMSEIDNYLNSYPGTYSGPSDVVKQEFILDLSDFMKHPSRTRFQETYSLLRNRDGKSVATAILYGLKLTKKSNLSPAVIAACKHQDELEVYLNCLNENKLSDFKAFNIIYEINPFKV